MLRRTKFARLPGRTGYWSALGRLERLHGGGDGQRRNFRSGGHR